VDRSQRDADSPGKLLDGRRLQREQVHDLASVTTSQRREHRIQAVDFLGTIVHNSVNYRWLATGSSKGGQDHWIVGRRQPISWRRPSRVCAFSRAQDLARCLTSAGSCAFVR
jgi:hypothetical protein